MTEVWKSQGRKFCEICKCWFGDNRASLEHHERGKKHKDALQEKLRELGRKNEQKARMESKMSSTLASMEKAALNAMSEHDEGVTHGPALPATGLLPATAASRVFDPKQFKDIGSMAREMAKRKQEAPKPKRPGAPSAVKDEPAVKMPKQENGYFLDSVPLKSEPAPAAPTRVDGQKVWVEATADYGRSTYYWNIVTAETTWDRPSEYQTAAEYETYLAAVDSRQGAGTLQASSGEVAPTKTEPVVGAELKTEEKVAEVSLPAPSADMASLFPDSIPMPEEVPEPVREASPDGAQVEAESSGDVVKSEPPAETDDVAASTSEETAVETSEIPVPAEPVKEEEPEEEYVEKPSIGPFGGWKKVTKVDSTPGESPLTAKYRKEAEEERIEAEERAKLAARFEKKYQFEEKVAATVTKKVKGPIEFKKKKTGPKNIRKRENID